MKKLIVSGFGMIMVLLIAMPAAAGKGNRQRNDGHSGGRHAQTYSHKNNDRGSFLRGVRAERREYKKDMKQNVRAMKRADSHRERAKIRHNMRADHRDFKRDIRHIRDQYRHPQHYYRHRPVIKHQHKGEKHFYRAGYHRVPGTGFLVGGFWH